VALLPRVWPISSKVALLITCEINETTLEQKECQQIDIDEDLMQGLKLRLIQAPMRLNFPRWRPNPEN